MQACEDCIALHKEPLLRLSIRVVGDRNDAEDIVQETFLNVFKAIENFDGRSTLGTWLYRIAYNNSIMHLRRRKVESLDLGSTPAFGPNDGIPQPLLDWCCLPERDLMTAEALDAINLAVDQLSDSLRIAFLLRDVEGLTTAETAEILSIGESAVKVRLHRARRTLQKILAGYFSEYANGNTNSENQDG